MICKFCGEEINDESLVCPNCGNSLKDTIEEDSLETEDISNLKVCPNCNAEVPEEMKFCNKCGWNFEANKPASKTCPKCGAELDADAMFCNKCGFNMSGEKRKKPPVIAVALIIVLLIVGGVGGFMYYQQAQNEAARQKSIAEYQLKQKELFDSIKACESNMDIVSTMLGASSSMGKNNSLLGVGFMTSFAEDLCASEIGKEKNRKDDIDKLVDDIEAMNCNEPEVKNLKEAMKNFYIAYEDRYTLLIEGNYSSYNVKSEDERYLKEYNSKKKAAKEEIDKIVVTEDNIL